MTSSETFYDRGNRVARKIQKGSLVVMNGANSYAGGEQPDMDRRVTLAVNEGDSAIALTDSEQHDIFHIVRLLTRHGPGWFNCGWIKDVL